MYAEVICIYVTFSNVKLLFLISFNTLIITVVIIAS